MICELFLLSILFFFTLGRIIKYFSDDMGGIDNGVPGIVEEATEVIE